MSDAAEMRVHPASPHRRQAARREGHVARSRDLTAALLLLAGLLTLLYFGDRTAVQFGRFTQQHLGATVRLSTDADAVVALFRELLIDAAGAVWPLCAAVTLIAIAANLGQVGFLFSPARIVPDVGRLSPIRGVARMFSAENALGVGWALLKLVITASVALYCLWSERERLLMLSALSTAAIAATLIDIVLWTGIKMSIAMLVLGLADYGYQWWRREQQIKMTPEEVREENRNQQGDSNISRRRREIRQQMQIGR